MNELQMLRKFYSESMNQRKVVKRDDRLDIGFLHASPLIYVDAGKTLSSPQLEFCREAKTIKKALKNTGQNIRYMSMVATEDNFSEMLRLNPQVLHISCHGHEH